MQAKNTKTKADESQTTFQVESGFFSFSGSFEFGEGSTVSIGKNAVLENCDIEVAKGAKLTIGEGAILKGAKINVRKAGAIVSIGKMFGMGESKIICDRSIKIGSNVWVGSYCLITDSPMHSTDKLERRKEALLIRQNRWQVPQTIKPLSLVIEDDCWVCDGAYILYPSGGQQLDKMFIGSGSVVGANAVVKNPILEPGNVVAGVPAKVVSSVVKIEV